MVAAYEADVYMEVEKHNFVSLVEVDTSNIFWNMINVLLMMLWCVTIRSIYVSQRITFVPSNYLFDCPAFFACLIAPYIFSVLSAFIIILSIMS